MRRLRRELARVREERDILKKALAIFSRERNEVPLHPAPQHLPGPADVRGTGCSRRGYYAWRERQPAPENVRTGAKH